MLQHLPPPPLHLVDLGLVNNILHSLESYVGELSDCWKQIGVKREGHHGGNFNGNEVRKILAKLDVLRKFIPRSEEVREFFIECLSSVIELKKSSLW